MTLLMSLMSAVISTVIWYSSENARLMKVGTLCYMFWGASMMWLVDAVFEYIELGAEYFNVSLSDMLNDAFLGMSVIVLAMIVWIMVLLIKDPKKIIWKSLQGKH
ncbi:MAG: hypothetical protein K6G00_01665 [Treponema sp.]|nr:hypothetical protein [Treponema sp.]